MTSYNLSRVEGIFYFIDTACFLSTLSKLFFLLVCKVQTYTPCSAS